MFSRFEGKLDCRSRGKASVLLQVIGKDKKYRKIGDCAMKNIVMKKKRSFMEKPRTPIEKRRTLENRTDEYLRLSKEVYINCKAAVTLKCFRSLLVDLNRFLLNEGVIGYQELKLGLKDNTEGDKLQALLGTPEQADAEQKAPEEEKP
jgi:hypothetical protein